MKVDAVGSDFVRIVLEQYFSPVQTGQSSRKWFSCVHDVYKRQGSEIHFLEMLRGEVINRGRGIEYLMPDISGRFEFKLDSRL